MVRGELNFVLRCPGREVGWLDSGGFEFNTTRPPSQCALEYNTSRSQSAINRMRAF